MRVCGFLHPQQIKWILLAMHQLLGFSGNVVEAADQQETHDGQVGDLDDAGSSDAGTAEVSAVRKNGRYRPWKDERPQVS